MIIDFHTHVFPDAIALKTITRMATEAGLPYYGDSTLHGLLAQGVADISVLAPVATKVGQWEGIVTRALAQPDPRCIHFASLHPQDDVPRALQVICNSGLRGIKLHPFYQQHDADHPLLLDIYRRATDMGLVVLVHAGLDQGYPGQRMATPEMFRRVADVMDVSRMVLAHMGGWQSWVQAEMLWDTPYLFDTSFSLPYLPRGFLQRFIELHGEKRLLWGTDWPWDTQASGIAQVRALGLSCIQEAAILGGNAARLLGINE